MTRVPGLSPTSILRADVVYPRALRFMNDARDAYLVTSPTWRAPAWRPSLALPLGPDGTMVRVIGRNRAGDCPVSVTRLFRVHSAGHGLTFGQRIFAVHGGEGGVRATWIADKPRFIDPDFLDYPVVLLTDADVFPVDVRAAIGEP